MKPKQKTTTEPMALKEGQLLLEYRLVSECSAVAFERNVNSLLRQGFNFHGPLITERLPGGTVYMREMTKGVKI